MTIKKLIVRLGIGFVGMMMAGGGIVQAHPLDETRLVLDTGTVVTDNGVNNGTLTGSVFIAWPQVLYTMKQQLKAGETVRDIAEKEQFVDYISAVTKKAEDEIAIYLGKNILLSNNGEICPLVFTLPEIQKEEVLLGAGKVEINVYGQCNQALDELEITDRLYLTDFEWQKNVVTVMKGGQLAAEERLNQERDKLKINLNQSTEPSPTLMPEKPDRLWWEQIVQRDTAWWVLIGIGFLAGALHTLEAGHSKTVLLGLSADKRTSFKQVLGYAVVFTLTHLSDIIVIGFILWFAGQYTQMSGWGENLAQVSKWGLLAITSWMLVKELRGKLKHEHKHHVHQDYSGKPWKEQVGLGIVTGLAPCLLGWSLFLAVVSVQPVWMVFPVIGAFGLGIFMVLTVIALAAGKMKLVFQPKMEAWSHWTPLISAMILWMFALAQIRP